MNPYWLFAIPLAWLSGYLVGQDAGRDAERKRVLDGVHMALYRLTSPLLGTLYRWIRAELTMDEATAEFDEYAAAKKAKRAEQTDAFIERLNKRNEKGTE